MKDEKQEMGEMEEHTFFDVKREEVGRIRLTEGIELVVYKAGDHLDMRLWVDRLPYKGLRFYLPEGVYEELKKLIDKVDKVYQERLELSDIPARGGEHTPFSFSGEGRKVGCKIWQIFKTPGAYNASRNRSYTDY